MLPQNSKVSLYGWNLGCYKTNEFQTKDAVYNSESDQMKIYKVHPIIIFFKTVIKDQQSK